MFQNKRTTISTVQNIASKVGGHVDRSGGHLPAPPGAALRLLRPVPRCSPFIIINKIPESTSFGADFNPYFPVPG